MSKVPDILVRLEKGAGSATFNAGVERKEGRTAIAALWDQFAANMEEAAAEIKRLRGKPLKAVPRRPAAGPSD